MISCLVEGISIRATVRVTGVAKNTIVRLLTDLGEVCSDYQDKTFRNLNTTRVEVDEIWEFVYAKAKNVPIKYENEFGYGDVWTWVAIDAESKLVPTWLVGSRDSADCYTFLADLKDRLKHRIQLTSDGHAPYLRVVEPLFGADAVDFAQLIKMYGNEPRVTSEHRYSPAECSFRRTGRSRISWNQTDPLPAGLLFCVRIEIVRADVNPSPAFPPCEQARSATSPAFSCERRSTTSGSLVTRAITQSLGPGRGRHRVASTNCEWSAGASPLRQTSHETDLAEMLQIVFEHTHEADSQGHGRVVTLVDDPVEVGIGHL